MTTLDFLVLTFAASAIVDVWRNGSIFTEIRAYFEARSQPALSDAPAAATELLPVDPSPWWFRLLDRFAPRWLTELLSCNFCFSHHAPWIGALVCYFPTVFLDAPWLIFLCKLPLYSLAATRLGNILNAWAPPAAQYDRGN
jgi:hypothetical protein